MNRIENIISRARDTLADPNGDRWTDKRLIRLIDEAQKDICRRAKLLRTKADIGIFSGQGTYKLPEDMLLLDRVLYKGEVLPFKSHLELDSTLGDWEDILGKPEYLVYDKQSRKDIKLYPIPNEASIKYSFKHPSYWEVVEYVQDDFGIVAGVLASECEGVILDEDFGLVSSCNSNEQVLTPGMEDFGFIVAVDGAQITSEYGIAVSLSEGPENEKFDPDNLGTVTEVNSITGSITAYYLRKPDDIETIDSILSIDDNFDAAIKYYIVGKALRDDMDTQNRVVGNEELGFYDRELKEAINDDTMDFTRNNTQYSTQYKGAF